MSGEKDSWFSRWEKVIKEQFKSRLGERPVGRQKSFPVCGCRYCPNAHLRHDPPYCAFDGEEAGEILEEKYIKNDGVFPVFCPLDFIGDPMVTIEDASIPDKETLEVLEKESTEDTRGYRVEAPCPRCGFVVKYIILANGTEKLVRHARVVCRGCGAEFKIGDSAMVERVS